jgi:hypothetical protein
MNRDGDSVMIKRVLIAIVVIMIYIGVTLLN